MNYYASDFDSQTCSSQYVPDGYGSAAGQCLNQVATPATPFGGENQKSSDTRRDRISEAVTLLHEEAKISADERAQAGCARMLRDEWYGKYNATRGELYAAQRRFENLEKEWHAQRQSDGVRISVLERNVAQWKDQAIERDLDNADLRRQLRDATSTQAAIDGVFKEVGETFRAGNGWNPRFADGTRVPMKFVLDVNMPPDSVEIRNSNGVTATIDALTRITPG